MEAATLTALTQSIEKWERNAVAETPEGFSIRVKDCALCGLFWDDRCNGCPVKAKTGQTRCFVTPYDRACVAMGNWRDYPSNTYLRDAAHAAARAEVAFLRSLLPEVGGCPDGSV